MCNLTLTIFQALSWNWMGKGPHLLLFSIYIVIFLQVGKYIGNTAEKEEINPYCISAALSPVGPHDLRLILICEVVFQITDIQ